jgi:hypothetical protein
MPRTITGLKIREKRRALELRQNELAQRVGISPSYLNLIERNKRAIGGGLLAAIGRELGLSVDELDGAAERRLRDQLANVADDPQVGGPELRAAGIEEFIARYPTWARGLVRTHDAFRAAESEAEALADRLAHDPALAEAVHAMLTEITALRSTAEILADPREIAPEQRKRFERIVDEQSARLAQTGEALARHFDHLADARRPRSAVEEAEEFLHRSEAAEAVEAVANRLRGRLLAGGGDLERALHDSLKRPPRLAPDWGRAQRLGALALARAGEATPPEIEAALDGCPAAAAPHARSALEHRLAGAILMPAEILIGLGARLAWNFDALVRAADSDGALVFRRIAELHRSGGVPRAGLLVADASGATLARAGALELLPRTRELACPVWPLHRAGRSRSTQAMVVLSGGETRRVAALARPDGMAADMLVLAPDGPAERMALPRLQVGGACRICTHRDCGHRREDSVVDA